MAIVSPASGKPRHRKARSVIAACLVLVLYPGAVFSVEVAEKLSWNSVFSSESVQGVLVLCQNSSHSCSTNNAARAAAAYIPASTFKIPNALIGLETGVIRDERQVFHWDGKPRAMKQWEKDLTLRGAMQVSAVPVFQHIARQIGEQRMQDYLARLSYGNANTGGGIDRFWLDGQIRISALGQVRFLESLYRNQLPLSKESQLIVKSTLVTAATPDYIIYSKTGFSGVGTPSSPGVAWWVGWVEWGTEVYFFAFNMDITRESQLPSRKSVPTKILALEGVVI